jgi:hypothetical protein
VSRAKAALERVARRHAEAHGASRKRSEQGSKSHRFVKKETAAPLTKAPAGPTFDVHTVDRFDPGRSLSFARELFETFALSYADTSLLTGSGHNPLTQQYAWAALLQTPFA